MSAPACASPGCLSPAPMFYNLSIGWSSGSATGIPRVRTRALYWLPEPFADAEPFCHQHALEEFGTAIGSGPIRAAMEPIA